MRFTDRAHHGLSVFATPSGRKARQQPCLARCHATDGCYPTAGSCTYSVTESCNFALSSLQTMMLSLLPSRTLCTSTAQFQKIFLET